MSEFTVHRKAHFAAPQWIDLVRGQLPEDVANSIDGHLRAGCEPCAAAFDMWQGFAAFASEERDAAPPDDAVRVAKSYFTQHVLSQPAAPSFAARAAATLATLVFDSRQTAPAGVRAAAATPARHLVFDAEPLVVDLQIEAASHDGDFLLAGQVADTRRPDEPLQDVRLSLVDHRQELAVLQTSPFGEFRCPCSPRPGLTLMVRAGVEVVAIPLETLFDQRNATGATH